MKINKSLVILAVAISACSNQETMESYDKEPDNKQTQTTQESKRGWTRYYSRYMKPEQKKELIMEMSTNPKYVTKFQYLTLQDAFDKAAEEGKRVFINCHTENCGPCRMMEKNIFPRKECGDYLNSNFVCISKDIEKGEGDIIKDRYKIDIYPTYLILNPDGTEVCKIIGAVSDANKFVNKLKEAIEKAEESK